MKKGKIDLSSIKNKNYNKKYVKSEVKSEVKPEIPILPDRASFIQDNIIQRLNDRLNQKPVLNHDLNQDIKKQFKNDDEQISQVLTLTENERNKLIAIINLYICEFPDKLSKYKSKNFSKMKDEELIEFKKQIQREVTTNNSLSMLVEGSGKALELYEYIMTDYMDINITGVSKLKESQEYKDCVKGILLKYMDGSLISQVEPEYKLAYLIFSTSLVCHQMNSMKEIKEKKEIIKEKQIITRKNDEPAISQEQQEILEKLRNNLNIKSNTSSNVKNENCTSSIQQINDEFQDL